MQERDLAAIGAEVEIPVATAYGSRRARRELRAGPAGDRLAELADWWASVSGTAPPRRVDQLWLAQPPVGGQPNAEVVIRQFDPPTAISEAIDWGVAIADDAVDEGTDLLLVSLAPEDRDEAGWQVLAAHLLDLDPLEATGWPNADRTTDREWIERVAAIRDGLRRVRGIRNEPERLLAELNSPALAAGTGLLLQAAARRTPAMLDGPGAAACALLAHRVARASRNWWQAADAGHRMLHDRVLTELRLTPLTRFCLPAEDGTAARIGLSLLETALSRAIDSADDDLDDETPVNPDDADLTDANPGDSAPSDADPVADPADADPGDSAPADADPVDANPGDSAPGNADPGDESPGDANPGEDDPRDSARGDSTRGDSAPTEDEHPARATDA